MAVRVAGKVKHLTFPIGLEHAVVVLRKRRERWRIVRQRLKVDVIAIGWRARSLWSRRSVLLDIGERVAEEGLRNLSWGALGPRNGRLSRLLECGCCDDLSQRGLWRSSLGLLFLLRAIDAPERPFPLIIRPRVLVVKAHDVRLEFENRAILVKSWRGGWPGPFRDLARNMLADDRIHIVLGSVRWEERDA